MATGSTLRWYRQVRAPQTSRERAGHDPRFPRLWAMAAGGRKFDHLIMFAFSFSKPPSPRDWRSFGMFSAFIVALFAEMYGFPLSVYLMSGWLQTRYPGLGLMSHDAGHLWSTLFGLSGNPHFSVLHILRGDFQNSRASLGATRNMHAAWSRLSTMKPSRS